MVELSQGHTSKTLFSILNETQTRIFFFQRDFYERDAFFTVSVFLTEDGCCLLHVWKAALTQKLKHIILLIVKSEKSGGQW